MVGEIMNTDFHLYSAWLSNSNVGRASARKPWGKISEAWVTSMSNSVQCSLTFVLDTRPQTRLSYLEGSAHCAER